MSQLIVRNLEPEVVQALKEVAAEHGRSAEEQHRHILRAALLPRTPPPRDLKTVLLGMPDLGDDGDFERIADQVRPVDL